MPADWMLAYQFQVTALFHALDGASTLELTFAGSDGGEYTTEIGTVRPGGGEKPVKLAGLDDTGELTLTKPFDRTADPANLAWLRTNRGCDVDAVIQPITRSRLPVGVAEPETCILATVTRPNADPNSNDAPMWGCTLAITEAD